MAKRPFQLPGTGSSCDGGDDVVKIDGVRSIHFKIHGKKIWWYYF